MVADGGIRGIEHDKKGESAVQEDVWAVLEKDLD